MILSSFLRRIKLEVPNIGTTPGVTDAYLMDLLNQGCNQANLVVEAYKTYTDFNIIADKKIYALSEIAPLYLGRDKRGVWFKDSNGEWSKVITKTEGYLSENMQNYLNSASVDLPNWYWIDGDDFGFEPAANAAQASGGRIYHLRKANSMTTGDHYPYSGTTTEISALIPLDEAIISWVKWKISPAFGAMTDVDLKERDFNLACQKASRMIKRAPDLSNQNSNGMRT